MCHDEKSRLLSPNLPYAESSPWKAAEADLDLSKKKFCP
jgi:hypothetical protein